MTHEKQTELEALKVQRAQAIEAVKVAEALEKQRTVLLPQLKRRFDALVAKILPLAAQRNQIESAINQINAGELTDYRLRKKAVRRAKGAQPAGESAE